MANDSRACDFDSIKLPYRKVAAEVGHPDGEERITQLNATFAHIEHEQRNAANHHGAQMFPVDFQRISFAIVLDLGIENGNVKYLRL